MSDSACVAADRNDNLVATCVNRTKPSGYDLVNTLSSHIVPESVLRCDGATAYNQLSDLVHRYPAPFFVCNERTCKLFFLSVYRLAGV